MSGRSSLVAVRCCYRDTCEPLRASKYGNPRYRLRFATNGETFTTATDTASAWGIPNYFGAADRRPAALLLTLNARGCVIGATPLPSVESWHDWERRTARGSAVVS